MKTNKFHRVVAMWVAAILSGLLLSACTPRNDDPVPSSDPASVVSRQAAQAPRSSKLRYALGIVGYNYTELGILDYSVNGTGAFNLGVSNEHSGGGKTVCCFGWAPGMRLPMPIHIEWTRDDKTWCRTTAMLAEPVPLEPTTFEVHFFPDRHVEVAITDDYSPPRLKLASHGGDFRIGKEPRKEEVESVEADRRQADCQIGRFPIGKN